MAHYWNYFDDIASTSTTTGGRYYHQWTGTTSTATASSFYELYIERPVIIERYVITGFENWSDVARAVLTRLINDETNTGFKVTLWARDIEITDPSVMIRDLDWFLMKLRTVASSEDYSKIADHIAQVRAEIASGIETQSATTKGRGPKDESPARKGTPEKGSA